MGFFLAATLAAPRLDAAQGAAAVQFVFGTAMLHKADGGEAALQRGDELREGDAVVTGNDGRVQLHFSDGGQVSLVPDSEFLIEAFRQSEKADAKERLFMRLVKGGLRTISGRIGKVDRAAYQMNTSVATIGIRGTEYTLLYRPQGGLTGSVAEGRIATCNAGGCLDVDAGQSFLAIDRNTQPMLIDKAADLGAPPPSRKSRHVAVRGKEKREHGKQLVRKPRSAGKSKLAEGSINYNRAAALGDGAPRPDKSRKGVKKETIVFVDLDEALPAGTEEPVRSRVSSVLEEGNGAVKVKTDGKPKRAKN